MAERSIRIEAIAIAAAPGTYQHALGNRLTAISALKNNGNHRSITFHECSTAHLLPVKLLSAGRFQGRSKLEFLWNRLEQGHTHLLSVRKSLVGINRQCMLEESDECKAGSIAKAFTTPGRPPKRPSRQDSGEIFV
jgi:hypothetical protein